MRALSTRITVRLPFASTTPRLEAHDGGTRSASGSGTTGPTVNGAEIAGGVLVFFLIGWGLDSLWDSRPIGMVAATVFGTVGYFIRTYYAYTRAMTALERERSTTAGARR